MAYEYRLLCIMQSAPVYVLIDKLLILNDCTLKDLYKTPSHKKTAYDLC